MRALQHLSLCNCSIGGEGGRALVRS
jgi:hypothetical protein